MFKNSNHSFCLLFFYNPSYIFSSQKLNASRGSNAQRGQTACLMCVMKSDRFSVQCFASGRQCSYNVLLRFKSIRIPKELRYVYRRAHRRRRHDDAFLIIFYLLNEFLVVINKKTIFWIVEIFAYFFFLLFFQVLFL